MLYSSYLYIYMVYSWRQSDTYMRKLTMIGSDDGLLPVWHQVIIWTIFGYC